MPKQGGFFALGYWGSDPKPQPSTLNPGTGEQKHQSEPEKEPSLSARQSTASAAEKADKASCSDNDGPRV